ncbi:hypothetical protein MMC07_007326 [Pseudocyphellaria aurata]|nr:hypothetical protein [Pseudocyphellaria aurata]
MVSRKRDRAEMESSEPTADTSMLDRLRNMWEFSNLMQYIFIFGKAVKIDEDFTIEDLETECLKPEPSDKLAEIGLALLKYVSSHRGLTPETFDEYTRRQYVAKAPHRNPFGTDETPNKFADFNVFTKLRILYQLSQWTLINADRMRERMPETKDTDQTQWRVEEIGYDKQERLYFVLDDNRLYRRTDPELPPPPAPKPKANSKRRKALARASRQRKTAEMEEVAIDGEPDGSIDGCAVESNLDDGFGGRKWECIAVTLAQYQEFLDKIQKSRDSDEKALHQRITEEVLPVIEKAEESQLKRLARKERELMTMQKLATAKRSSRLAGKMEREREEQEALEADRKRKLDLLDAKKDQERQKKMDEARESRMMTREQRLKDREYKRILHEEELANLSEDNKRVDAGKARMSERHLKAEMEKKKKELAALAEEDEWVFDCSKCGIHGDNVDDGSHSIACEKCNVWQHSACHGISEAEAEKEDFHFICRDCQRRAEDAKKPKIPTLKFHLGSSSSPPSSKSKDGDLAANGLKKRKSGEEIANMPPLKKFKPVEGNVHASNSFTARRTHGIQDGMHNTMMNGPTLSPEGQVLQRANRNGVTTQAGQPPPGLRSPPGRPAYLNGYASHAAKQNGHLEASLSSPPSEANGTPKAPTAGWSASYVPPQTAQTPQQTKEPPPFQNSYLNSLDRQRPDSSHSAQNLPSPIENRPSLSPPQSKALPVFPPTPTTNGVTTSHPPRSRSPVKQQSSPLMLPMQLPSSSPINHPPLQKNVPTSSGLSPTKQSPPPRANAHDMVGTPALPPVPSLEPSGGQQDLRPPTKSTTPERQEGINGVRGEI